MTDFIFIYLTAPDAGEAKHIARALVEEKLAACVNILPPMTAIYRWHNGLEESTELAMIVKTRASLFDAVAARVKILHSASNPCIVALPLVKGAPDFLSWLASCTKDS